ncbi:MFS transporter [Streptomyces sp. XD-27]|uniref:MFS transporter n=1 Tax=Streptomyces sp. XD-27 TaxID=3062779 RepID=UPI0026F43F99|nr:MFS transporter [Streptomyces sp. XD-27]WKX73708.1 MFS transporter [Streptomyces sp. XD-27]
MLAVTFVDRVGSGLAEVTAVLYFTYVVGLGTAQIGLLLGVSGAIGIAGPPLAGLVADRVPLRPLLVTVQAGRAVAAFALLTTTDLRLLLVVNAVASLGNRASSVLTKLYATRVAGPDRTRYQAVNRTVSNSGWAVGGLVAAAALTAGTTTVYRCLLIGDALSFVAAALLTLRCTEPASPTRAVAQGPRPAGPAAADATETQGTQTQGTKTERIKAQGTETEGAKAQATQPEGIKAQGTAAEGTGKPATVTPWRDRRYLLYTATEAALFLDDSVLKIGLPLWLITATSAPHQLAPLLLVLNNALVVLCQVPFARFGATPAKARRSLLPLAAVLLGAGAALAASAVGAPWFATGALLLAATAFTVAEMLHAAISWELSVALAPPQAQGAYLGVHGLAQAVQRSTGPLAVTAAMAAGPLGWLGLGAALAATCCAQRHLVRDADAPALSVAPVTVSEH